MFLDQRLLIKLIVDVFVHSHVVVWASVTNCPHIIILTPHDWWVLYVRMTKNLGKKKVTPPLFTNRPYIIFHCKFDLGQCQMAANEHNGNMCNLFDECSRPIFGCCRSKIYFKPNFWIDVFYNCRKENMWITHGRGWKHTRTNYAFGTRRFVLQISYITCLDSTRDLLKWDCSGYWYSADHLNR